MNNLLTWLVETPLLRGLRSVVGRSVSNAIEAKHGSIIYYREPSRSLLLDRIRSIKRETRMLLSDTEALFLYELVQAVEKIPGAIGEVGTYRGGSARLMAEASKGKKEIHTLDTFEGLPPLKEFDDARFHAGQYATPVDAVRAYLSAHPSIKVYQGFFPDSAGPIADKKFSFVHLDVDIYQSTLDGLKFFYPRLNKGGMLVSHDYSNAEGVHRAFEEFFLDKPEAVIQLSGSQCLVVKL